MIRARAIKGVREVDLIGRILSGTLARSTRPRTRAPPWNVSPTSTSFWTSRCPGPLAAPTFWICTPTCPVFADEGTGPIAGPGSLRDTGSSVVDLRTQHTSVNSPQKIRTISVAPTTSSTPPMIRAIICGGQAHVDAMADPDPHRRHREQDGHRGPELVGGEQAPEGEGDDAQADAEDHHLGYGRALRRRIGDATREVHDIRRAAHAEQGAQHSAHGAGGDRPPPAQTSRLAPGRRTST